MELKSQHSHLIAKEQITLLQQNSFFNLLCCFLHFAQMWSLYSEINNFIKNESRNIAVKSSVSDSFQYVSSYEETTSTFSGKKLLTSLCCLINKSNLFTSKSSLRWTQAGETDWQTLVPSNAYAFHSNSTLRLIKTGKCKQIPF